MVNKNRFIILSAFFVLLFAAGVVRLTYLSVLSDPFSRRTPEKQKPRGDIIDTEGKPLAMSLAKYNRY
jgi:cell division protein FtsI/penicillin-binding protein 2